MSLPSTNHHVRLAPERFYWALLQRGGLPRSTLRRQQSLGYLFESVLPVPIESLHAIYLDISEGVVLACGIGTNELREATANGALSLGPAEAPAFVREAVTDFDVRLLNLLTDVFESPSIRRARRRAVVLVAGAMLLASLAVSAGQLRRAARLRGETGDVHRATLAVYDSVLSPSDLTLPPAARLTAELRSLSRTRAARADAGGPVDVAPLLADFLANWPRDLHVLTDSLSVAPTAVTLNVRLPAEADAERFERELRPPNGWQASQPNLQRERDAISMRVRMEPGVAP